MRKLVTKQFREDDWTRKPAAAQVVTGPGRECCYDVVARHLHTVPQGAMQYLISGPGGCAPGERGASHGTRPTHNSGGWMRYTPDYTI